jgi:hypothetical protein
MNRNITLNPISLYNYYVSINVKEKKKLQMTELHPDQLNQESPR